MRLLLTSAIIVLSLILLSIDASAQCSMCKAVVESNAQTGDNIVEGVNSAILYLMGVPYLLIVVMGFFWHKKFGKSDIT